MNDVEKMEYAFRNIESLALEVEANTFIPIRFRKLTKAQWNVERPIYLNYLIGELKSLRARINNAMKNVRVSQPTLH